MKSNVAKSSVTKSDVAKIGPALSSFAALALVALGTATAAGAQQVHTSQEHSFRVVTVAEGLQNPWSIAFLPNGDMLVTERPGRLRAIRNGQLVAEPISGVPAVHARGQGGLLDVQLHPNFAQNQLVYLSYSKLGGDGRNTTAIARGRLQGNALLDVQDIFVANAWSNQNGHFGSRIQFDRNGFLFATIGDRQQNPVSGPREAHGAQQLNSHQGKVIRLHDDGRVPADNPFVNQSGALPEIWSYGHRSPQGLFIHPTTGDIWQGEHAAMGGDEVNLIVRGANYGWPVIGEGVNYGGGQIHESNRRAGMEPPKHFWIPSIATSGLLIYTGDRFPGWRGSMFVGGLVGQQLARVEMSGQELTEEETLLAGFGRIRDIRQGPDGLIYLAIDAASGATLVRLEPAGGGD